MHDVGGQVRGIIGKELQVPESVIRPGAFLVKDLGADSFRLIELTLVLEETFDIEIEDEDMAKFRTVQDAIDFIENGLKTRRSV